MTVTTLTYTGAGPQSYTVPAGVTYVTLECWGAQGGFIGYTGNYGGYAKGKLVVAPGTVLNVYVGGFTNTAVGGYNGGGAGGAGTTAEGAGGGGGSDVRLGGTALSNRVIVAGGGGGHGGGLGGLGGFGGGASGGVGGKGGYSTATGIAGTQTVGTLGFGTPGGTGSQTGGGGGGGGYRGGGSGHNGNSAGPASQGGGGGSGYLSASLVSGGTMTNNVRTGQGQVVITAVSVAPLAPTLTGPPNNGYIVATETNAFTWVHSNVDPGGYQSSADLQYKQHPGDAWTTLTSVATTASTYTLPASTWAVGNLVEWQVKTYGAFGAASPWSASGFTNTIASVPAPTITTPTAGTNEFATPVELDWTLPGGFTSDSYQVQRTDLADGSGVVYYDSGTVAGGAVSAMLPLDAAAGRTDYLRVRFHYYSHWSVWASVNVLSQYGPPAVPVVYVVQATNLPPVTVTVTNPPSSLGFADTLFTDVFRTSPDGSTVRIATSLPNNSTFTDLLPTAGVNEYIAVAYAASGGSATSPVGYFPTPPSPYSDQYTDSY